MSGIFSRSVSTQQYSMRTFDPNRFESVGGWKLTFDTYCRSDPSIYLARLPTPLTWAVHEQRVPMTEGVVNFD
jgi:hypothetical protein